MKKYSVKAPWLLACVIVGLVTVLLGSPLIGEGKDIPGTIVIKYIQDKFGPVTFNHAIHTSMAESCGQCHHQHNDKARATCKECHALDAGVFKSSVTSTFSPCSGCHSDPSPEMPEMPSLKVALHKTCFKCHVGIGELGSSPAGCAKTCHAKK